VAFVFVLRRAQINLPEVESSMIVYEPTLQSHQVSLVDNRQATVMPVNFSGG
jgi:hypothetical protein